MTLPDLIARVEAAEGPDRELDAEIERTLPCSPEFARAHPGRQMSQWNENAFRFYCPGDEGRDYLSPPYTASLEAAMTLVPEGWFWLRKCQSTMTVVQPATEQKGWATHTDGKGATPALALLAACLRARG